MHPLPPPPVSGKSVGARPSLVYAVSDDAVGESHLALHAERGELCFTSGARKPHFAAPKVRVLLYQSI